MSAPQHSHSLAGHASFAALPAELIDALNQTYHLHLLITEPQRVIPPGKSLLSMMTQANFKASDDDKHTKDQRAQIEERVKEVAHKAFWNEALEALSSPLPSVQLTRLKRLYFDLYEALSPLFPPNHAILVALSSPLPPTSSPLHTAIVMLQEILVALRLRCAPVRDQAIDELLASLSIPPEPVRPIHTTAPPNPSNHPPTPLAEFVIEKTRAILQLAEDMKADLKTFVLGSMTDSQLRSLLLNDVKGRERELVLKVWGGADVVRSSWRAWIAELPTTDSPVPEDKKWITRLFYALESDKAVCCILPSPGPHVLQPNGIENMHHVSPELSNHNNLPPQLFFSTPSLLYIQNNIQAIVIAAVLRSLTCLGPSSGSSKSPHATEDVRAEFMSRIWALLKAEIDESVGAKADSGEADGAGQTKLINLADEVVSARRRATATSVLDPEEEKRLRAAVEHVLRSDDPVFKLLKRRLVSALEKRLLALSDHHDQSTIPAKMQTGKDLLLERVGKRPKLMLPEFVAAGNSPEMVNETVNMGGIMITGFEDRVLQDAIADVLQKIAGCMSWVEAIWGDLV